MNPKIIIHFETTCTGLGRGCFDLVKEILDHVYSLGMLKNPLPFISIMLHLLE